MITITTDTINKFIQSKGGSISIQELVNFLSEADSVITGIPKNAPLPRPECQGTKYISINDAPTDPELFDKFLRITRRDENGELSKELFDKRCAENGVRFEFLDTHIVLSTGATMTGKLTSVKDGKYIYIRDWWVAHNVPSKHSRTKTTIKKSKK